jgi:hypothetical protein
MDYLGQHIELIEEELGWLATWCCEVEIIQIGFFLTRKSAAEAIVELIQRDLAVRSLYEVITEWETSHLISEQEFALTVDKLTNFVLWQDSI